MLKRLCLISGRRNSGEKRHAVMQKKAVVFLLVLITGAGLGVCQEKPLQISAFFGLNRVYEYGMVEDYVLGENDFPVTPAHTSSGIGMGLAFFLKPCFAVELETRYIFSSKVRLTDPSDADVVEIETADRVCFTIGVLYRFLKGPFRPYIKLGGGVDRLSAGGQTYTSQYGFEIEFAEPEDTMDFMIHGGFGAMLLISPAVGLRLDVRYALIFGDPYTLRVLNPCLGFFLRF